MCRELFNGLSLHCGTLNIFNGLILEEKKKRIRKELFSYPLFDMSVLSIYVYFDIRSKR